MNNTNILLRHNYIEIPNGITSFGLPQEDVATILVNLTYYGYALNAEAYQALLKLNQNEVYIWWKNIETNLKEITGDNRKIDNFVVYKNFPDEVLDKSEAEYWIPQILMYWGLPNELFTQEVKPRDKMDEKRKSIVLKRSKKDSLNEIFVSYLKSPTRWKDHEFKDVLYLSDWLPLNVEKISFKENLVKLASTIMESGKQIQITTATDVLRLAAGLSDGDVSLRDKSKFISFKKPMRRFLLSTLERCNNLAEDVARRPEMWKRLFEKLHPGDYRKHCENVCEVMDYLYNDRLGTFNSKVEALLQTNNVDVLGLLSSRPGEFRRRLVHVLDLFGAKGAEAFISNDVLKKLTTAQIVSLRSFLATVNSRNHRVFPPKGNWNKLQIGEPRRVKNYYVEGISTILGSVLKERLPKVKVLDPLTKLIKLPNNGEASQYTRGTIFPIPDDVEFIRTASYWKIKSSGNVWFDNGWNFFDSNWKSLGACCWNEPKFRDGAVFSGDPTNSKEMKGRAAQLIDLYPNKLLKQGVRYAVWNILCFSHISFDGAEDVFAALQWGKDPQKGKLFEPSRCQLSFPLTSKQMTKYICMIDLKERKMVYLDANLQGKVDSAKNNGSILEKNMPAFLEYLDSLPSVYDLFCESVDKNAEKYILYSDKDVELKDVSAYVFKPENKNNKFTSVNINQLL